MKTKRILGLDLGQAAFKMVLLEVEDSGATLIQARLLEIPPQAGEEVRKAALISLLEGVELARLAQVASVVDDPFACVRVVSVPPMPEQERADAVKWELQKFLAVPPEEVVVDCKLLSREESGESKKQRLLAVALPAAVIREQLAFLGRAGVRPTHLIPKTEALNAWLRPAPQEAAAILEVGGSGCEFVVFEKGEVVFARKIAGGGVGLTKEMTGVLMTEQGQVSLTEGESETVKRSVGIPQGETAGLGARGVSGMQIFSLIRGSLERLAVEAERSLAFYSESGGQSSIGEVVLVGGGAHLKGLAEWLQGRLGVRVRQPKVFKAVQTAPGALQGAAASAELSMAAALGAALGAGKGMNFLPRELQENLRASIQKAALKAAVTGVVLGAVLLWMGLRIYQHSLAEQITAFELERKAVASQVPALHAAAEVQQRWIAEPDWREIFRRLTHQVPAEIYLTEWVVDGREATFRGRVRRQGQSADEVLTRFMEALEQGAMTGVALRSSRQMEESADEAEFEIGTRLK